MRPLLQSPNRVVALALGVAFIAYATFAAVTGRPFLLALFALAGAGLLVGAWRGIASARVANLVVGTTWLVLGYAGLFLIGTEFNVLALPTLLQVGVRSGRVALTPDTARPGVERELGAGDTASIDLAAGMAAEPVVVQGAADAVGSWRDGMLIVEAEPLARVLEKLARYRTGAVTLDGAAGTLLVSGTIDLRRPDAFLRALPDLLPGVQLHWQPDGTVSIGAARRS